MDTALQAKMDVAFGFFDDLSIEEKDRVTYILYGPKVTDTDLPGEPVVDQESWAAAAVDPDTMPQVCASSPPAVTPDYCMTGPNLIAVSQSPLAVSYRMMYMPPPPLPYGMMPPPGIDIVPSMVMPPVPLMPQSFPSMPVMQVQIPTNMMSPQWASPAETMPSVITRLPQHVAERAPELVFTFPVVKPAPVESNKSHVAPGHMPSAIGKADLPTGKPYERRNKKKRPTDYYRKLEARQSSSTSLVNGDDGEPNISVQHDPQLRLNDVSGLTNNVSATTDVGRFNDTPNLHKPGHTRATPGGDPSYNDASCGAGVIKSPTPQRGDFSISNQLYSDDSRTDSCLWSAEDPQYEVVDTPQHKVVDTPQHKVVDMPQHKVVDMPQHKVVDTPQHKVVDMPQHKVVDTTQHKVVDTPPRVADVLPDISTDACHHRDSVVSSDDFVAELATSDCSIGAEPHHASKQAVDDSNSKPCDDSNAVIESQRCEVVPDTPKVVVLEEVAITTAKPVVSSWAGLFKGRQSAATGSAEDRAAASPDRSADVNDEKSNAVPTPVPVEQDASARQLGQILLNHKLCHRAVPLLPRGLCNRGNWCYVNATLQALLACPPFYHLLTSVPSFPALSRGPSSTPVINSLVEFVNEFSPMSTLPPPDKTVIAKGGVPELHTGPVYEPVCVYKMLQVIKYGGAFKHGRQEDAEEFLGCVLDSLHEEMAAAMDLLRNDAKQPDANGDGVVANGNADASECHSSDEEQWEEVKPRGPKGLVPRTNNYSSSPTSDIFRGQIRSILHQSGARESPTLQPFYTLQLDIQSDKVWSLKDALEGFVCKESLQGYMCSKTKQQVEATRRIMLEKLPVVLVLHLKCFVYDKSGGCQKITNKQIEFPVHLDIGKDLLSPTVKSKYSYAARKYKLFAVVNHHGTRAIGGHYTTDVFHAGVNGWIRTDDSGVKSVSEKNVLKQLPPTVPYLLYYRRYDMT